MCEFFPQLDSTPEAAVGGLPGHLRLHLKEGYQHLIPTLLVQVEALVAPGGVLVQLAVVIGAPLVPAGLCSSRSSGRT